ncbi:TPA: hypothetical protein AB5C39_003894, partial [Vibrio mimicus]
KMRPQIESQPMKNLLDMPMSDLLPFLERQHDSFGEAVAKAAYQYITEMNGQSITEKGIH